MSSKGYKRFYFDRTGLCARGHIHQRSVTRKSHACCTHTRMHARTTLSSCSILKVEFQGGAISSGVNPLQSVGATPGMNLAEGIFICSGTGKLSQLFKEKPNIMKKPQAKACSGGVTYQHSLLPFDLKLFWGIKPRIAHSLWIDETG